MKTTVAMMLSAVIVLVAPNAMSTFLFQKPIEHTLYDTKMRVLVELSRCVEAGKLGVLLEQRTSTVELGGEKSRGVRSFYLTENNLFELRVQEDGDSGVKLIECWVLKNRKTPEDEFFRKGTN